MYGLIGKILCAPGQRDTLTAILAHGTTGMPGCISYVIAHDAADPDGIWVTEVWDSQHSHQASLARPLIAGFGERVETRPVAGPGLPAPGLPD